MSHIFSDVPPNPTPTSMTFIKSGKFESPYCPQNEDT